jgi:hypothetical protein
MATRPNDPYVQPPQARPTAGTYPPPPGAAPVAPTPWPYTAIDSSDQGHSAYDELQQGWDAGSSTLGDGAHESTLD